MHIRLRPLLLSFAALAVSMSATTPALASAGQALSQGVPHSDLSAWSVVPTPNRSPYTNVLHAASCVSATDCTAVGWSGNRGRTLVESWNGTAWSVVPSPTPVPGDSLSGVSCLSATDCTAVGGSGTTLIESWNGTAWSVVPSPNPASTGDILYGVSCVSATDCTAVGMAGEATLVESWNGTAWSVVPSPSRGYPDELRSVSCVSATDCTAVGQYQKNLGAPGKTLVESWNGTTWSLVPSPNRPLRVAVDTLYGVSCVSATDCTAVGDSETAGTSRALAESWNGTAWSLVPVPQPARGNWHLAHGGVVCVGQCLHRGRRARNQ